MFYRPTLLWGTHAVSTFTQLVFKALSITCVFTSAAEYQAQRRVWSKKKFFFLCSAESAPGSLGGLWLLQGTLWQEELLSKAWQARPSPCCGFPVTSWGPEMLNNRASVARPLPSLLEITTKSSTLLLQPNCSQLI